MKAVKRLLEVIEIRPSIRCASSRAIARPSPEPPAGVRRVEALEDPPLDALGDARPLVGDGQLGAAVDGVGGHGDVAGFQFDEPVDRIISIEAFEAFPKDRYAAFFETCYRILPGGGRMVLQTILGHPLKRWPEMGIPITMTDLKFMRFIAKEIFPGGAIPCDEDIAKYSGAAGFSLEHTQYLNEHYVRTLDTWATNLEAASEEAVAATSEEVYDRYMRYLVGCSDFFRRGISELGQFTLTKS